MGLEGIFGDEQGPFQLPKSAQEGAFWLTLYFFTGSQAVQCALLCKGDPSLGFDSSSHAHFRPSV